MTQEELRKLYCDVIEKGKQCYIAKQTGINPAVLSRFKNGEINLYPHLFEKLEKYLNSQ